ncbi:hydroxysqualene dehydroxylase HpnE [Cupriavidus gilardii]|uniref:hydroxysqualene dehydroxylase HpnE n=1 Tax=Cupriavidus gilardii TaxID=82541 RepID=UPI0021C019FC|nr:hydroxysqualene dehydroxylase HpnE [Cupriavidus gilardii]MCT9118769.1 hydroxysqualene dehydroxylase HpnE [Cupriavidus gilardii]
MEDVDTQPLNTAMAERAATPAATSPRAGDAVGAAGAVGIIGGGWAGMAAALELAQAGRVVQVFEAAPVLGGRARRVARRHPQVAGELDNGQHLLLGAYRHTLALMRRAGVDPDAALLRLPLQMAYADGWRLQAPRLPAPWHLVGMGLTARGLGWRERAALAQALSRLRAASDDDDAADTDGAGANIAGETVAAWLAQAPSSLRERLWFPLCVAALNTPAEQADARVFRRVLRDSLLAARGDSDMLVPRRDLSRLFPEAAAHAIVAAGGTVRTGAAVQAISQSPHGWLLQTHAGRQEVAQLVVATAPRQAARLLAQVPHGPHQAALQAAAAKLQAFDHVPIVTLYLNVGALRLPRPFLALDASAAAPGQFVFDRAALSTEPRASAAPDHDNVWSVVISAADDAAALPQAELARRVRAQLATQLAPWIAGAAHLADARGEFVIAERLATFRCIPGLARPGNDIGVPRLALAGDYTDGRDGAYGPYPATIEAATRSGSAAAALLQRERVPSAATA